MKALIDADLPAYELGGIKDKKTDEVLPFEIIEPVAKGRFLSIMVQAEAGGYEAYLSRGPTFRDVLATILPYKGNRVDRERPKWTQRIKDLYSDVFSAQYCDGYEADDAMAMSQWSDYGPLSLLSGGDEDYIKTHASTVICSRDKDLDTVPGWHFKWMLKREQDKLEAMGEVDVRRPPYYLTLLEATRNFYIQLLTGDMTDNIRGLFGVGPKSACVKRMQEYGSEAEMFEEAKARYEERFGAYWRKMLTETARLLWMWRKPDDVWLCPDERDNRWYMS